jgi:hypothetical protein
MNIETLEPRIAPAALIFNDVDGDTVTINTTAGDVSARGTVVGGQLQLLDLTDASFQGASISVKVAKAGGGDGLVNIGRIDATSRDLGSVTIPGDLAVLDAGDGNTADGAVKSLAVRSMGRYGLATQGAAADLQSNLPGGIGALKVAGDVEDVFILVTGGSNGRIGTVSIGGSLVGGDADLSGRVETSGDIGSVKITGNLEGGAGQGSGFISCFGKIGALTIGGSVLGGSGMFNGKIYSQGDPGPIKIGGDLKGGTGDESAFITSDGSLMSFKVGGSIVGGAGEFSGGLSIEGRLGSATIGGSISGGSADHSGFVFAAGDMGPVKIGRDIRGGTGNSSGDVHSDGGLASLTLGGSIVGGSGVNSGYVHSELAMGAVKIGGGIFGGTVNLAGYLESRSTLGSVTVAGSLVGGAGSRGGNIFAVSDIGAVKIGGDVRGGSGVFSGSVESSTGKITSISLGGSLAGGSADDTGYIFSGGELGPVKIARDVIGGSVTDAASLDDTGLIQGFRIVSISIGGSVVSGTDDSTGTLTSSGVILANKDIGAIKVKGALIGNSTANGTTPVMIWASGQAVQGETSDIAIGSLTVGGRVEHATILAGYSPALVAVNGDAQIGKVKVGGDWIASNLVAGVMNAASTNTTFGDANDAPIGPGDPDIVATIASIAIKGIAAGTVSGTDHFGFSAERILSFKSLKFTAALTAPADETVELSPTTDDMTIRES